MQDRPDLLQECGTVIGVDVVVEVVSGEKAASDVSRAVLFFYHCLAAVDWAQSEQDTLPLGYIS